MGMLVPIVATIGCVLLFAIIGGGYFIYSLITSNTRMNGETKTKALDVFMYLGIGITLVTSVYNLLQILFTAINRKFADVLTPAYVDVYNSDMRLAVAFLVVMFPLYLFLSWYVAKDISTYLYKRDLTIRKVMIYTTLFVTICSLIGTLVSIIYTFLGGELTIRFGAKALAVLVVSSGVFGYYFYSLRREYSQKTTVPLIASIVATLVVVGSVVWSISIVGSPAYIRALRLDSNRLSDISTIQQQVFNRFQNTDKLPLTLEELNDAFQGFSVPVDPVTKEVYGYKVIQQPTVKMNYTTNKKEMASNAVFELCGNFETVREVSGTGGKDIPMAPVERFYSASNYYYEGDQSPFWNHGVGETCFRRIITPDMYYGR